MLTLASTVGRWLYNYTIGKTMNYTINEKVNKGIDIEGLDHLSFFYKFEITPKEHYASVELNAYVDEDKARLMAANIIAEKIANKLIYHKVRDADTISRTVLSFSERHVEIEEREQYENDIKQLSSSIKDLVESIDTKNEEIFSLEEKTKKKNKIIIGLSLYSALFVALNILQFFN